MSSFFTSPTSASTPSTFHQTSQLLGSPSSSGGGMSGSTSPSGINTSPATSCCEGGRPIVTDPVTGQSVCSCQYDPGRLALSTYPRLTAYGGNPYAPPNDQNPYPSLESSAFYSPLGGAYAGLKEGSGPGDMTCWPNSGSLQSGYYSYDPTFAAAYGYGGGYDLAARRKNATRESTATLKAWLNEHKKNPYPTKGEKIMLAIITKMTLTQVSTWFANARRRLKKENKMTWEPKNKTDDDDEDVRDDDDDCDSTHGGSSGSPALSVTNNNTILGLVKSDPSVSDLKGDCKGGGGMLLGPGGVSSTNNLNKPKIWSLADTAACKTPPPTHPNHHHLISNSGVGGGSGIGGGSGGSSSTTSPNNLNHHHLNALNHHAIAAAAHQHIHGPPPPVTSSWSFSFPGYHRSYGGFLSPTNGGGMSHSSGLGPTSDTSVGTDTPPQTPPNLKVPLLPGSLSSHFNPHHGGSHMNNAMISNSHSHHHPHHHPHSHLQQHHHSTGLNSTPDLNGLPNSTAFKPVLKSSSGGGFCV